MKYRLSKKSRDKLKNVHPDLILVVGLAIQYTEIDFSVLEGKRSIERQRRYVESGSSTTMDSRHLLNDENLCFGVDLGAYVGGRVQWAWPLYVKIAKAMKQAASELGIPIEWGGDWKTFKDGPHFQLPRKYYR